MNLVVANFNGTAENLTSIRVLTAAESKMDRRLADLSMQVDDMIFRGLTTVDVVYVCRGNDAITDSGVVLHDAETAYFPNGIQGSFYCSPEVFSNIGKLYKLDFARLKFVNMDLESEQLMTEKILFALVRMGYTINVKK